MRPEERDAAYVWDMLSAARMARELLEGVTREAYLGERMRQLALERALELLGEAARRVSDAFQSAHPQVEWRSLVGQRNVLAHEYGVIDQERLYRTGKENVPGLIAVLETMEVVRLMAPAEVYSDSRVRELEAANRSTAAEDARVAKVLKRPRRSATSRRGSRRRPKSRPRK